MQSPRTSAVRLFLHAASSDHAWSCVIDKQHIVSPFCYCPIIISQRYMQVKYIDAYIRFLFQIRLCHNIRLIVIMWFPPFEFTRVGEASNEFPCYGFGSSVTLARSSRVGWPPEASSEATTRAQAATRARATDCSLYNARRRRRRHRAHG